MVAGERKNQKQRTRDALVQAAVRLLRSGATPTVSEVAREALVSPATAYRYFPSARSLWAGVLHGIGEPTEAEVFAGLEDADAETRVAAMIERVGRFVLENEAFWRTTHAMQGGDRLPLRTGQRMRWIQAALEPVQREIGARGLSRLSNALALIVGADTMLTLRDVLGLSGEDAREVSVWAGRALVRAAVSDKAKPKRR